MFPCYLSIGDMVIALAPTLSMLARKELGIKANSNSIVVERITWEPKRALNSRYVIKPKSTVAQALITFPESKHHNMIVLLLKFLEQ